MESERKYLDADLQYLKKKLVEIGATSFNPHFEINIILDTPDMQLMSKNQVLRLRKCEWHDKADYILTCKFPPLDHNELIKIREEIETHIENLDAVKNIFQSLGYKEVARYEKVRESFFLPIKTLHGVKVELDELPFCNVAEIEGSLKEIETAEKMLGLDKSKISIKTYYELHQEWLKNNGLPLTNGFEFLPEHKKELRRKLDLND